MVFYISVEHIRPIPLGKYLFSTGIAGGTGLLKNPFQRQFRIDSGLRRLIGLDTFEEKRVQPVFQARITASAALAPRGIDTRYPVVSVFSTAPQSPLLEK